MRGRFITFEGIEGCGKSTQHRLLAASLQRRGIPVLLTREPGGTPFGEALRTILLDPVHAPTPLAELFVLEAARTQHVTTVIAPALEGGTWVLSDRFADASSAYQGIARHLGLDTVAALNATACGGIWPDRTLVLDLDVEVALARARTRATTTASNRRFEDETFEFHRAVALGYRELAAREPDRVRIVEATGTEQEVLARVLAAVEDLL